jgi:hypothetical protein
VAEALPLPPPMVGRAAKKDANAARESRRRSCTRPGTLDTATSKTDLARSTPICIFDMRLLPRLLALWGRFLVLARWCRSREESIPSLAAAGRSRRAEH